jgi:hypothetical protein
MGVVHGTAQHASELGLAHAFSERSGSEDRFPDCGFVVLARRQFEEFRRVGRVRFQPPDQLDLLGGRGPPSRQIPGLVRVVPQVRSAGELVKLFDVPL